MKQSRGEDPERFAARIKQSAPACRFTADGGTPQYGANIMSTIFILGLEDTYTRKQLYQLKPAEGKTTVSFEKLVDAASEISTAKDNVAEASNTSMFAMSGDKNKANAICGFCNTTSHNANGFSEEMRKKFCKAYGRTCDKCQKINHISAACKSEQIKKRREENKKKATVREVSAVEVAPAAVAAAPVAAAPAAVLNSVHAVAQTQQPAGYVFNPKRF